MTAPRGKVEASLAERGRPAMWANEQEAAVLSGYSPEAFRSALAGLERVGFPQINTLNGKRFIPAIINFWACQIDSAMPPVPKSEDQDQDGPQVENFGHGRQRQAS
jgi:hypothetical protein